MNRKERSALRHSDRELRVKKFFDTHDDGNGGFHIDSPGGSVGGGPDILELMRSK